MIMRLFVTVLLFLFAATLQQQNPVLSEQSGGEKGKAQQEKQNEQSKNTKEPCVIDCSCLAVSKPKTGSEKADTYNAKNDTLYRVYLIATIAGVAGALAGILIINRQTKFLRRGAEASEKAVTLAADNFRVQQRAWVSAWVEVIERTDKYIDFRVHSKNTGATPALNVSSEYGHLLKDRGYVLESDFSLDNTKLANPEKKGSRSVIPPHEFIMTPKFGVNLVTAKDAAIDKESWLFVCGTITYDDIFGQSHTTTFCQRVEGKEMVWANTHNSIG
jgi:hypothetical protein